MHSGCVIARFIFDMLYYWVVCCSHVSYLWAIHRYDELLRLIDGQRHRRIVIDQRVFTVLVAKWFHERLWARYDRLTGSFDSATGRWICLLIDHQLLIQIEVEAVTKVVLRWNAMMSLGLSSKSTAIDWLKNEAAEGIRLLVCDVKWLSVLYQSCHRVIRVAG